MRAPFTVPLLVIAFAILAIAGYDVWLYCQGGGAATISIQLRNAANERPLIAFIIGFAVGVLIGHLFWP